MPAAADWDLSQYFAGADTPDYTSFTESLASDIASLASTARELGAPTSASRDQWVQFMLSLEELSTRFGHWSSYLSCRSAADVDDEVVQRETGRRAELSAAFDHISVSVRAAFAAADDNAFDQLCDAEELAGARYHMQKIRERARLSMDASLESLAADLSVDGLSAWGRLYNRITGGLTFTFTPPDGEPKTLPVAMVRSLLEDGDPAVRRAAHKGASAAWESVADSLAACLNAISGTRLTLYKRRGIDDFLTPALVDASIERETLDAMHDAVRSRQSIGREYLKLKADKLGLNKLAFCDLLAPLSSSEQRVDWKTAVDRVLASFHGSYKALGDFASHAVDNRWIDYTARSGKRPGGFCTSSKLLGESRVFMTFNGATGDVQTLAHELGHAFHNWVMKDMRPFARYYPMTLAETASTFAEQVVTDALLSASDTTDAERLAILDHRLIEGAVFTLNIPMRFDFEHALYTARADGEVPVSQLKEMMLDAQKANFGDAIDHDQLDPWYWASKLHFYITGVSFYNFPYTFGYLFSLGLFARAKAEGTAFLKVYEQLLRATGSGSAETVAKQVLGVDLSKPDFWNASLDLIEADLEAYR